MDNQQARVSEVDQLLYLQMGKGRPTVISAPDEFIGNASSIIQSHLKSTIDDIVYYQSISYTHV